jgi:hypothetical protein
MARVKINMFIDPEFKAFLEQMKETTGTPISRIMEIATMEKYKDAYKKYQSEKRKGVVQDD